MNSEKEVSIYINSNWVRHLCSTADVHCNNVEDVVQYLKSGRVKKVVVMTGAGISTASGIPDFRFDSYLFILLSLKIEREISTEKYSSWRHIWQQV